MKRWVLRCFLKDATEGLFLIGRERVPKNWGVVTKRSRQVFNSFINSTVKSGGMKELEFRGTTPSISGRKCRGELILLGKQVDLG